MICNRTVKCVCVVLVVIGLWISPVIAAGPSLDAWKPSFDPSGAKYKCIVSNVSHPVIKGVYAGFAIRDELWKRTNGQIYLGLQALLHAWAARSKSSISYRWVPSREWASVLWQRPI
jgi:hypothetical protein